jgi:two-component system chemotaxis response regulator CheY
MGCIFMPLSRMEGKVEDWFMQTAEIVLHCLGYESGRIYLHEGNVAVVARNVTQKNFSLLSRMISRQVTPESYEQPAYLYELPADGRETLFIFDEPEAAPRTQQAPASPRTREKLPPFNADLIATIAARREHRQIPIIFMIEDDLFTQQIVSKVVGGEFNLLAVQKGRDAGFMYALHAPDIVFLDIGLPDISGQLVLQELLEIDPDAYTVMLSAQGSRDNVIQSAEKGARGFIGKPFTPDRLLQCIYKSPFIQAKKKKKGNGAHEHRFP